MRQEIKNIHILPTDKPSRLIKNNLGYGITPTQFSQTELHFIQAKFQHIYITSNEEITGFENNIWVIKGNRIFLWQNTMALVSNNKPKKIIITTDQDLINNGVQGIDDDFLEWFVNNPSCEEVEVNAYKLNFGSILYKIIIPKEKSKQETLEEAALILYPENWQSIMDGQHDSNLYERNAFIKGAKWQQERMYSKEEVEQMINSFEKLCYKYQSNKDWFPSKKSEWFEQCKKK